MATKHTPGPWRPVGSKIEKHREARFIAHGNLRDGGFVGKAYGHDGQPVDANARLIAAAPELLDALIDLMDAVGDMPASPDECWPYEWPRARAAIAKAKGEPNE